MPAKLVKSALEVSNLDSKNCCSPCKARRLSNRFPRILARDSIGALALFFAACGGGGGGSSSTPVTRNPVPGISSLSPSTAPAGSRDLTLTVYGSSFIPDSVVQWAGSARTTTYVSSAQLNAAIPASELSSVRTAAVSVFNPAPGGGTSGSLSFSTTQVEPLSLLTRRLPDASHTKLYEYALQAAGGIQPHSWSVASGSLPEGLILSSGGVISGTPAAVSADTTVSFTAEVSDYAYQPDTLTQLFSIVVRAGQLGRNDTCGTATPVSNGVIRASVSPYGDIDVYSFQGTANASLTAEIYAQRLNLYSNSAGRDIYLDSLLEILDADCVRLIYHDDINIGVDQDSLIEDYTLPYTGAYYIRISDLRGDGRPDFIYELHLSGVD